MEELHAQLKDIDEKIDALKSERTDVVKAICDLEDQTGTILRAHIERFFSDNDSITITSVTIGGNKTLAYETDEEIPEDYIDALEKAIITNVHATICDTKVGERDREEIIDLSKADLISILKGDNLDEIPEDDDDEEDEEEVDDDDDDDDEEEDAIKFTCKVCGQVVSEDDGDEMLFLCDKCAQKYDVDKIWTEFDNDEIADDQLRSLDLSKYLK